MFDEKLQAVKVEVQRLLDAHVIREVKYPQWLVTRVKHRGMLCPWELGY